MSIVSKVLGIFKKKEAPKAAAKPAGKAATASKTAKAGATAQRKPGTKSGKRKPS